MTEWVLIIAIYLTGDRGGVSIAEVGMTSKESCEVAGKAIAKEWQRGSIRLADQVRWICAKR